MSTSAKRRVFVVGNGMTKFEKPGRRADWDYPQMAREAVLKALRDAKVDYREVQQVTVGYVYGDSTCGQRAVYEVGLSGVPIYNVNNNCSTGSTALLMAKQFVEGGIAECVLALGFEKMDRGSLSSKYTDRTNPLDKHIQVVAEERGIAAAPFAPQLFGNAGVEHMEKYGTTQTHLAKIAWKNHKHSVANPYSQFRDEYSLEQILKSPPVFGPLTKLQCCPTSDGAAAALVVSEDFVRRHNLEAQAVEIAGMAMATDMASSFGAKSCIKMVGFDMSRKAALEAYKQAGMRGPEDAQVVELHDCFSANELITYEALGLAPEGKAAQLIEKGDTTYGGRWVVNPSGGLISKGHPLGATGLAQCAELCWQLRQMANNRQVPNCKAAIQHNIGLGGAVVVGVYRLGFPDKFKPLPAGAPNPAVDPDAYLDKPAAAAAVAAAAAAASPTTSKPATGSAPAAASSASAVFDALQAKLASEGAKLCGLVKATFLFNIKLADGSVATYFVDLKNAPGAVKKGSSEAADVTLTLAEPDFVALMSGKANGQQLFMSGKMKLQGKMALAGNLKHLQTPKASL